MRASRKPKPIEVPPCDLCNGDQTVYGAILYGPPEPKDGRSLSEKTHVCVECYDKIFRRVG